MTLVVGMCDGATAIVAMLSVVVMSMVLDRCAECVLENLGQDIFHVDWDITGAGAGAGGFLSESGEMIMGMGMGEWNARESGGGRTVYYDGRGCAKRTLAKLAHERAAHADHLDG